MLIVLSEALRSRDLQAPLSAAARDALLNLSTAAYGGKHLVTGSRLLFGELQQLAVLGPMVTGRFKNASAFISDANALRSKVSAYIRVHPIGHTAQVEIAQTDGAEPQLIFSLPLDYFADAERAGCSWLVGEHLRDATTYVALGKAYATKFRGFDCALREMDGHGGATPQTFRSLAEHGLSVLCIVDSDRTEPAAPLGQTAVQALACHEALRSLAKVATVHVLPCRELENLLPAALVLDVFPNDPKNPHHAQVHVQQRRLGGVDFAELKDLVKLEHVSAHLAKLSARKCAELCFSRNVHAALLTVGTLVWSFGLASRQGRT
jgi:hypothetical protein